MRRKPNIKLLAITFGCLVVAAVGVHFLHGYQTERNAFRLLERAESEKDDEKALALFSQYLGLVPNDVDAVQKYAMVLDRRAGDSDRVRVALSMEQVLRAKPNEEKLRLRLVHNLIALERYAEAIENLKKLLSNQSGKADVLHMIGWCHDARKDHPQAAAAFEEAIRLDPKQVKSYALLAEVLQEGMNQPDEALKVMDDLVSANPGSYQAHLVRGRFQRRRGDDKAAQADLAAALKLGPDKAEVILEAADAARVRGDWPEAFKLLRDGMTRFPDRVDFVKAIAGVKIHNDRHDEAIEYLTDGLRKTPQSTELTVMLTDLLIDQKRYTEARARVDALVKAGIKPALPNYLKARLACADGKWSEAIKLLENVRRDIAGSEWSSRVNLLQNVRRDIAGSEWSSRVNLLLGWSYRALGDHDQELVAMRRAVADEPTWTAVSVELANALLNNGRLDEARQALEPLHTAKDLPDGYWILLSQTRLYGQLRLPEAERHWDTVEEVLAKATQANPKNSAIPIVAAEMLTARGEAGKAMTLLENASRDLPDEVALTVALADLAVRLGRFNDAEKVLDRAADRIEIRLARCRLYGSRGTLEDRAKLAQLGDLGATGNTLDQRVRILRELAATWQRLGDANRAETYLRELARALPSDLGARSSLLDLALQGNQLAKARTWLEEIRAIEGDAGLVWRCGSVSLLIQAGREDRSQLVEARKKLAELDKLHKHSPRVAMLAGAVSELEGNQLQAIEDYGHALEFGATEPRVLATLLRLLLPRREFNRAEAELARYEQKRPLTPELARLGVESALGMREKQYARAAVRRAELAVGPSPRDYRDVLWLARVHQAAGEHSQAETLVRAALDQAGHTPESWIAWMELCVATNRRDEAVRDLERMKKELSPSRQPLALARCYEALHLSDKAVEAYQAALAATPDDFVALSFAADCARHAERNAEARDLYEQLLEPTLAAPVECATTARRHLATLLASSAPDRALAHLDESRSAPVAEQRIRFFIQSQTPAARKVAIGKFEATLRSQPLSPDERLLFARMLESADRLSDARTLLSDLVDESPTAGHNLARYAHLLLRMNELDDAERVVTRLEALEPGAARTRELRAALTRALSKS